MVHDPVMAVVLLTRAHDAVRVAVVRYLVADLGMVQQLANASSRSIIGKHVIAESGVQLIISIP
jgi:hypothetical protein